MTGNSPLIFSVVLIAVWLLVLGLARRNFFQLALIGFPGAVLHECMHAIVGLLLFAKPTTIDLIPRRQGNAWLFGSVSFTGLNLLNAAPVAYAPLLLLGLAWLLFQHWMLPLFEAKNYLIWALSGYLISCALFYSPPSVTDIKVGGWSSVFWGMAAIGGWWLYAGAGLSH